MQIRTDGSASAPQSTMADVLPTLGVSMHGAISQRRAGSGDPAYSAVGRAPSRGGIYRAMYNHYTKQILAGSLLTLMSVLAQAQSERLGIFENLPLPALTNATK